MSRYIPLSVPVFEGNEWNYVKECIDTAWVSSAGKFVNRFEQEIAKYTSSSYAIACINGTAALHVSLLVVGVQPQDEVIVPTITFIAPINAIKYCGAVPVFMDADRYYNIDVDKTVDFINKETKFENGLSYNIKTGCIVRAIIPVHVFGNACNLNELIKLCKQRNIKVVEDATESLGTRYLPNELCGMHTGLVGDIGCFSFNGNKIITTGGGGMIVTNNYDYAERLKYLTTQAKDDVKYYVHNDIGYNYRMSNVAAALGVAQLEFLESILMKKKKIFQEYRDKINQIFGLEVGETPSYANNNHWLVSLQLEGPSNGRARDQLIGYLSRNGIEARPLWLPNHRQKPYKNCQNYFIEKAELLYYKTINLPSSVSISEEDLNQVVECIRSDLWRAK